MTQWPEQLETSDSNINKYDIRPKERHPSGRTPRGVQHQEVRHTTERTTPEWLHTAVACNIKRYDIRPKERHPSGHTPRGVRGGRLTERARDRPPPATKHLWGYLDSKNYRSGAPIYEQGGTISEVAECRFRHDMMMNGTIPEQSIIVRGRLPASLHL